MCEHSIRSSLRQGFPCGEYERETNGHVGGLGVLRFSRLVRRRKATIAMGATIPPKIPVTKILASNESCTVDTAPIITTPTITEQTNTAQAMS